MKWVVMRHHSEVDSNTAKLRMPLHNKHPMGCEAQTVENTHFSRRVIQTRKVGQIDVVLIRDQVGQCMQHYNFLHAVRFVPPWLNQNRIFTL